MPGLADQQIIGPGDPKAFSKPMLGEKRFFKLTLSPEHYFVVDAESFCHAFMARVQSAAGRYGNGQNLSWLAVAHGNTRSPHFHFVIRGLDSQGEDVFLPRKLIKNLRLIAEGVQEVLSGGLPMEQEDLREFLQSDRVVGMKSRSGLGLDQFLLSTPPGSTYQDAMAFVPLRRKRAFHARLRTFVDLGLCDLSETGVLSVPESAPQRLRSLKAVAEYLRTENIVEFAEPSRLIESRNIKKPRYGLVTKILRLEDGSAQVILETLGDETVLLPVSGEVMKKLEDPATAGRLFHLRRGDLSVVADEPVAKLRKLHAQGKVVTAILGGWKPDHGLFFSPHSQPPSNDFPTDHHGKLNSQPPKQVERER